MSTIAVFLLYTTKTGLIAKFGTAEGAVALIP